MSGRVRLRDIAYARSGDKGSGANVGVIAKTPADYEALRAAVSAAAVEEFFVHLGAHDVVRYELPNLKALNFVLHGLLGEGVASSTRFDPQAKALGEWLRSREVEIPEALL